MSLRVLVLSSIVALCSSTTVYDNPKVAGGALDAIEQAMTKILSNPRLTAEQLKSAKTVSASVEKTVGELESKEGKALSKAAIAAKVTGAINQLQGLQSEWQKAAEAAVSNKKADLMKKLAEKEGELAKETKMLKVINLEKKLAEKKLALEKLIEAKNEKAKNAEDQKEVEARTEMVTNVLNMAKSLQQAQGKPSTLAHAAGKVVDGKAAMLKTVLANLEGRVSTVTANIAKVDATEKKREAEVADATKGAPTTGADDAMKKGQAMLKMLMKKEHRQFEKVRAPMKAELKELTEAVASIKKGDAAGLTKVMNHMQGEMKSLQAKSHKFLY